MLVDTKAWEKQSIWKKKEKIKEDKKKKEKEKLIIEL